MSWHEALNAAVAHYVIFCHVSVCFNQRQGFIDLLRVYISRNVNPGIIVK